MDNKLRLPGVDVRTYFAVLSMFLGFQAYNFLLCVKNVYASSSYSMEEHELGKLVVLKRLLCLRSFRKC